MNKDKNKKTIIQKVDTTFELRSKNTMKIKNEKLFEIENYISVELRFIKNI